MKYLSLQRFKDEVLKSEGSPRTTSLSLAVGVFLAFSPFPGFHLVVAFFSCRLFRLNPVVMLVGVLVHNPWTLIGIHMAGLILGDMILFGKLTSLETFRLFPWNEFGLRQVFSSDFWSVNGHYLVDIYCPFFIGSLLLSFLFGFLSFHLVMRFLHRNRVHAEGKA